MAIKHRYSGLVYSMHRLIGPKKDKQMPTRESKSPLEKLYPNSDTMVNEIIFLNQQWNSQLNYIKSTFLNDMLSYISYVCPETKGGKSIRGLKGTKKPEQWQPLKSLTICWDRSSCMATVIPDGIWVILTALFVVFACWPPDPPDL